jgi:hypothetical protein
MEALVSQAAMLIPENVEQVVQMQHPNEAALAQDGVPPDREDASENEVLSYEEALMNAGGFGRFQLLATTFFMFSFITPNHILYALPFFELFPVYKCPEDKPDCGPADNCKDPSKYPVNWDSPRSLHNWVDQLGLNCADSF